MKKKAVFLDRDGVINKDTNHIKSPDELILYPFSATAIKALNHAGFIVVIITNQSVIARQLCTEETLDLIHKKMERELEKRGAYIDKIYYCPHYPDKNSVIKNNEWIKECDCRKPKPGMLLQAEKDLHIDLSQSFFIGDSERDIQCGKAVGVTTIGVSTGNGVVGKTKPDFMKVNILDAAKFIATYKVT